VTGTIVRVENQTIGQAQGMETTPVFSGTGPNDLSVSADDYIEQDPRNFTVTITHKDLPYASVSMSGSPFIPGETITGQNSGSTAQIVYADYTYVVLENIVGIFDNGEMVTSSSSSGYIYPNGQTTDMITVNNTDTTVAMPIILTGNTAINGVYVYFSSSFGHEIGDQWTFTVSYGFPQFTVLYLDNVSGASVSTDGYSIVGVSSGQTMNGILYIPPLGAVGDTVRMFNVSDFNQTTGSGIITAINDGVYTISGTGSPNASDVIMNMSDNNDGNLSFVYSATSEEIPSLISTGFVSNNNILGLGVKGTGFVQSNNNSGVFSGVFDASSFGGSDMSIGLSYFGPNDELASINVNGGTSPNITISSSTSSGDGFLTINPTSFLLETRQNGNTLYGFEADTSTIGWRSGNERYFLPTTMPNNGDVLAVTNINGNEITLGFTTSGGGGGGSSPISVNGTTLYSSGLSGTGDFNGYNIFLGTNAGNGATGAQHSNFLGYSAGGNATNASNSNFLGYSAGGNATNASNSNFLGNAAGNNATNAAYSNFLGYNAGQGATGASYSNFLGYNAGQGATNASYSNFSGWFAGQNATNASNSNFFGYRAGNSATEADYSIFIGTEAGYQATNANRSIFIGPYAGYGDTVDNSSGGTSILIGNSSSTGGYSNSIAIGAGATNTATNQFMIGSATRPIDDMVIAGSGFTTCSVNTLTGAGISCSSDERLKTNIEDLESTTLDTLLNVKTVRYNWNANPTGNKSIGFIAQDLQQYFPELVKTGHDGYLQVNYGGITPILVEAIREMNLKITTINDMETPNTWRDSLIAWFGNVENGIVKFFAGEIETKKLCIADDAGDKTCITKAQLDQLLMNTANGSVIVTSPSPDPAPQDSPSDNSVDPSTDITEPTPDAEDTTVPTPDTSSDSVPSDTESVPDTSESSTATE
jgi:hypothetical protein